MQSSIHNTQKMHSSSTPMHNSQVKVKLRFTYIAPQLPQSQTWPAYSLGRSPSRTHRFWPVAIQSYVILVCRFNGLRLRYNNNNNNNDNNDNNKNANL